jgi:hypothetical protein
MQLTLRKANAVQAAINDEIKSLDLITVVALHEFEDARNQIQTARDKFYASAGQRESLLAVLYEIRSKVAKANAASGINDMLATVAYLDKQISFTTMASSRGAQTPLNILNGQLKATASKEDIYSRRDVSTSIFTEQEVLEFKQEIQRLKREKQKLQDDLLELNVQTVFALSETSTNTLKKAGIL